MESPSLPTDTTISHQMVVDKVSTALDPSQHEEGVFDSSDDEEDVMSDDDNVEMSDKAEEIDDLMALDQFWVEQR